MSLQLGLSRQLVATAQRRFAGVGEVLLEGAPIAFGQVAPHVNGWARDRTCPGHQAQMWDCGVHCRFHFRHHPVTDALSNRVPATGLPDPGRDRLELGSSACTPGHSVRCRTQKRKRTRPAGPFPLLRGAIRAPISCRMPYGAGRVTVLEMSVTADVAYILPFNVAPFARVTDEPDSTIPSRRAVVSRAATPAVRQKMFLESAPPASVTVAPGFIVRPPAILKTQTSVAVPVSVTVPPPATETPVFHS